jgi:hypothetical protein
MSFVEGHNMKAIPKENEGNGRISVALETSAIQPEA